MKKIQSALISVFYKDGLENIIQLLHKNDVKIYSTGGTQAFIEKLMVPVTPVESITNYPSILGGRVKTLHPLVFGGILGVRDDAGHVADMAAYNIPEIDLVIVDLYPFEKTVAAHTGDDESPIIEKIDIGGPSMLRAAAKNFKDVMVVALKKDYAAFEQILQEQAAETSIEQRREYAIKAFDVCTHYDTAISAYFHKTDLGTAFNKTKQTLRYGENPHQSATFHGELNELFHQLHGKELSYNNLVDVAAAIDMMHDLSPAFPAAENNDEPSFAIFKHTNACGAAQRETISKAWEAALSGDPESAFGGVLISNKIIDTETAIAISEIFFEVLMAPDFTEDALGILQKKKNRIILRVLKTPVGKNSSKTLLDGTLVQQHDEGNFAEWTEAGDRSCTETEKQDLIFANIICKHLKSNAIAIIKDKRLLGKGCGQTSRVDALRHAVEKAKQFSASLDGAVLASDAFFPFDDCVKIAHENGITAVIQPGGSIRDADSIAFCKANNMAMVITGLRHFKH